MGLKEMVAQLQQTDNAGSGFNALVQGFQGGIDQGRTMASQAQSASLDRATKLIDLQTKLADIAQNKQFDELWKRNDEANTAQERISAFKQATRSATAGLNGTTDNPINTEMGKMDQVLGDPVAISRRGVTMKMSSTGGKMTREITTKPMDAVKTPEFYTPPQAAYALHPDDPQAAMSTAKMLTTLFPDSKIPKDYLHQGLAVAKGQVAIGEKKDQYTQKRLTSLGDALDPSKQRQGAFGVSKQVFDRAERLQSLASAFADGNLDSRQMEEIAIGLNAMLSGSNTGAQEQVKTLVPKTIMGNAQKLKEWLTNDPQGTAQQAFVQRMMGSVEREKQTASDQIKRTQYSRIARYEDLAKSSPDEFTNVLQSNGIDPTEYDSWKKSGRKPISAVQKPEGGATGASTGWTYVGKVGQ